MTAIMTGSAYGVVRVGGIEIAIPASALQQVVRWPDQVQPRPPVAPYMRGVFSLRGRAVPLVDLHVLLGLTPAGEDGMPSEVALLHHQEGRFGIGIDAVADVIQIDERQLSELGTHKRGQGLLPRLFMGGSQGERIIYLLDIEALASLPELFMAFDHAQELRERGRTARFKLKHYILLGCDGRRFCLEATAVSELVEHPRIDTTFFQSEYCLGVTELRGTPIPVLNLSRILGLEEVPGETKKQLLVMTANGHAFGFAFTELLAMMRRNPDDLVPMPRFGLQHSAMFSGVMSGEDGHDALLLNHTALLRRKDIQAFSKIFENAKSRSSEASSIVPKARSRQACLVYEAGIQFASPLHQVDEILHIPTQFMRLKQAQGHLIGMINVRGQQVSLICLSSLINSSPREATESSRILLVTGEAMTFGFAVCQIDAIETFNDFDPGMLEKGWQTPTGDSLSVGQRARTLVSIGSGLNRWRATLLDLKAVARELEAELASQEMLPA